MDTIVLPVIHLNGTSRAQLVDQLRDAYMALREAKEKLMHAAPNARDYYPVPGRWELALKQHRQRLQVIDLLMTELTTQADLIQTGE